MRQLLANIQQRHPAIIHDEVQSRTEVEEAENATQDVEQLLISLSMV
jgi:hypothetical protein